MSYPANRLSRQPSRLLYPQNIFRTTFHADLTRSNQNHARRPPTFAPLALFRLCARRMGYEGLWGAFFSRKSHGHGGTFRTFMNINVARCERPKKMPGGKVSRLSSVSFPCHVSTIASAQGILISSLSRSVKSSGRTCIVRTLATSAFSPASPSSTIGFALCTSSCM